MALFVARSLSKILRPFNSPRILTFSTSFEDEPPTTKKKKPLEVRLNLIYNRDLGVMSIEAARRLAKKKGAQLVPVQNPEPWMLAGNRPAYELLTSKMKVGTGDDDTLKKRGFKGLKHSIFKASIHDHDIETRIKQINRWLRSNFAVDVAIDVSSKSEELKSRIANSIEDEAKLPGTIRKNSSTIFIIRYEPKQKAESGDDLESKSKEDAKAETKGKGEEDPSTKSAEDSGKA